MTLLHFIRLFNRNLPLFLLCSVVMAAVVFLFTRNLPKVYESETEIYTGIASGLDVDNLGSSKVDYNSANTEYDNLINIIKSRQTLEEVGVRLLAQHLMLDSIDPNIIKEESYQKLQEWIPNALEEELVVPYSVELTLRNIRQYKSKHYKSRRVQKVFYSGSSPYSYNSISSISVERVQNSDLLRIGYKLNDPGIAQNTLRILNEVFTANVTRIKIGQSSDVVNYFRKQVKLASERLDDAEQRLQEFRTRNRMINYEEQTRSLAINKEAMEDELMKAIAEREATESALKRLNEQLSLNRGMIELGNKILEKKKSLVDIRAKIAELETYYNDVDLINKLRQKGNRLEAEISNQILERYQKTKTTDGIQIESIIGEWLNYTLKLDEIKARLKVYEKRQQYFEDKYTQFAQLGAKAARLEREIGIAESNYMEVLSSLNQAMLRQRSQRLSSGGLVVTVPPRYPLSAEKSKAMLLTLVAAVIGFIVPFAFLLLKELLDSSIRTPSRAETLTKLSLLGAYPELNVKGPNKNVDFEWLHDKAAGLLAQNFRMLSRSRGLQDKKPKYTLVFSTRDQDGKQFGMHVLANELASLNHHVLVLSPKELPQEETPYYEFVKYENNKGFINSENLSEIMPVGHDPLSFDYIFLILEGILTHPYPINLLGEFDLAINVVGAFRSWNQADSKALKAVEQAFQKKPSLLLNGVEPDFMQNVLGDIAKERTWIRRFFKRVLKMELRKASISKSSDSKI